MDKIKSCSVIIQMKPLWHYFHLVLIIFSILQSEILEFFVLLWQCKVENQVKSLRVNLSPMPKFPVDPSS